MRVLSDLAPPGEQRAIIVWDRGGQAMFCAYHSGRGNSIALVVPARASADRTYRAVPATLDIKGLAALQGWSDLHHLLPRCRRSCLMVRLAAPSYLTVNAISPCEAPWSCIDRVIQRNAYTPGASRRTPE